MGRAGTEEGTVGTGVENGRPAVPGVNIISLGGSNTVPDGSGFSGIEM